jgi:hypothetical protein
LGDCRGRLVTHGIVAERSAIDGAAGAIEGWTRRLATAQLLAVGAAIHEPKAD